MIAQIDPSKVKGAFEELQHKIPQGRRTALTSGFASPNNTQEWIFVILFKKMQG